MHSRFLHPQGIVPEQGRLIYDEAQILGEIWGVAGQKIFLLVGVATLFGTQLALVDGVSRSISDIIYTNFQGAQKRSLSWWYLPHRRYLDRRWVCDHLRNGAVECQ